jgi:TonB family protein
MLWGAPMKRLFALLFLLPTPVWSQPTPPPAEKADSIYSDHCPYPEAAMNLHAEGITVVSYRGTDEGRFVDVTVEKSSGNGDLDAASVQCVSRWRFDPTNPQAKFHVGNRRSFISWKLSGFSPGTPPVGVNLGVPHRCLNYPDSAWEAGIEGTVTLRFTITEEGRVRDIAVEESSGNADLDAAAVECARPWRYRPTLNSDKLVAVPWKAKVTWKISVPPPETTPTSK